MSTNVHYSDVIMGEIASQITSLTIVYSTVYSDGDQIKYQSFASLVFVWGIHRGPVNSPHKWPVTRKMFPFDDVIMTWENKVIRDWEHDVSPIGHEAIILSNPELSSKLSKRITIIRNSVMHYISYNIGTFLRVDKSTRICRWYDLITLILRSYLTIVPVPLN